MYICKCENDFLKPFFEREEVNKHISDLKNGKFTPKEQEIIDSLLKKIKIRFSLEILN